MNYRFYITHNAQPPVEVFPLEFSESSISYEREEGQQFFRRKFDGRLVFMNRKETTSTTPITDFTYLKGIEDSGDRCLELSLDIHRKCNGEFSSWWKGYFSVTDGSWNLSRCSVEFKDIKPDDEYRCLLENGDSEVNILNASPIVSTSTTIVTDYEFYTCRDIDAACSGSLPAGGGWLLFHTEEIEGAWTSIYYREIAVTACLANLPQSPGGTWSLLSNTCSTDGFATYVRTPVTVYTNNPNPDVAAGDCEPDGMGGYLPVFPPRAKILNVTRTNTPVTPAIIGYDKAIASISGYDEEYTFTVPNNPGSSYTWSGTFVSVISGQGTNTVTVKFTNTGTITLQVVETTICSTAAAVTKNIEVADPGALTSTVINQDPTGISRACKDQSGVIFTMPVLPELFVTDVIWSVPSGGATIAAGQGTNQVTIDFGDGTITPVTISFSADNTTPLSGANINGSITVDVSNAAITPDIEGIDSVCPNASGLIYNIQDRSGATYTWTISGGTITAGQGTNEITVDWDNSTGSGYVKVKEEINCGCIYTLITECGASGEPSFYWCPADGEDIVYDQNRTLEGVLDVLTAACGDIQSVSDFFEMNPPGDTPGYAPGVNYVTGDSNKVSNLLIAQKSDIIDPTVSQAATRAMVSFNSFMGMLREMFQVYWLIEGGNLRLEHISWFTRTANPNFDLTDPAKTKYIDGKNIYSYEKAKMPKYERYKWSEALNTDFIGAEIRYDSICVNQDPKSNVLEHAPGNVATDIGYIFNSPTEIEKTGLVFLVNDVSGGVYTIASETGRLSGLVKPNMHLSWANLHYNYHRHNRVLNTGYMNNTLTIFIDPRRTKKQADISVPYCCDEELDPMTELVTTFLGAGEIDSMKFKVKSNTITITLLHDI